MTKKNKLVRPKRVWSEKIKDQRAIVPGQVDWDMCAQAVDELYEWIYELCDENYKLKQLIKRTIKTIKEDNNNTRNILQSRGDGYTQTTQDSEE